MADLHPVVGEVGGGHQLDGERLTGPHVVSDDLQVDRDGVLVAVKLQGTGVIWLLTTRPVWSSTSWAKARVGLSPAEALQV